MMSIDEMKRELVKTIERLPTNSLQEALDLMKRLSDKSPIRYDINSEIDHILREDAILLKRLAE